MNRLSRLDLIVTVYLSGLSKEIYEERVTKLAQNCALFAKDQQVKLYVELSSAQVYGSSGKTSKVSIVHTVGNRGV